MRRGGGVDRDREREGALFFTLRIYRVTARCCWRSAHEEPEAKGARQRCRLKSEPLVEIDTPSNGHSFTRAGDSEKGIWARRSGTESIETAAGV